MNNTIQYLSDPIRHTLSIGQKALWEGQTVYIKKPNEKAESHAQLQNEMMMLTQLADVRNVLRPVGCLNSQTLAFPFIEKCLVDFQGKLDIKTIQEKILKSLLETAMQLHQKQIVHGDIKLENIYLTDDMELLLGDFGKASLLGAHLPHPIEALSQHRPADITVSPIYDVYSIGVIAYQLLFGAHFMRDFQLKGRNFALIPESQFVPKSLLDFISIATDLVATNRFSSASCAYDFLFTEALESTPEPLIEPYDLDQYFEVYLECMKQTFLASNHPLSRFDDFISSYGEKYFQRLKKWSASPDTVLLHLKYRWQIVGILEGSILKDGDGMINTLFIHSNFRSRGLAQKLETVALDFFRNRGCRKATLNVAKDNLSAIRFYQKNGWSENEASTYPDAIRLTKDL